MHARLTDVQLAWVYAAPRRSARAPGGQLSCRRAVEALRELWPATTAGSIGPSLRSILGGRSPARSASAAAAAAACGTGVLAFTVAAVVTARRDASPSPGGASFLMALVAAGALYGAATLILERRPARLDAVLALAAAIQLVPLAGPLLLSADVRSYAAYGRIDEGLGANPYVDVPASFPADPVTAAVAAGWRETPSIYGPVFAGLSRLVAAAAADDPAAAARLYRLLAAVSMLALVGLAAAISDRPDRAAAFVGWNPLLAVHFAGGGHNDATMMLLVLAAVALSQRGRPRAGAVLWAGATAIKWVPAALWGLSTLAARRRRERSSLGAFAAAAAVLALAATWRYGVEWTRVVAPLARAAEVQTRYSLVRLLQGAGIPAVPAAVLLSAAALAVAGLLVRAALTGRALLGLAACALVLLSPWLLPWYVVWPVSLAAAERGREGRLAALALTGYLLSARVSL